jgi:hypothetical protein
VLKASAVVAVVAAALMWRMMTNSRAPVVGEITAASEVAPNKQELNAAYASAKAAVESVDWKGMQQYVLAAERVDPLMFWFYARHPHGYQVRKVSGFDQPIIDLIHQPATATLRLLTDKGVLHMLMQQTPEGWKMDWESFSNVYAVLWAAFLTGEANIPNDVPMPVEIEVCPPSTLLPSWFVATGLPRENAARAVRLFVAHPTNVGAACWGDDSPVGREILGALKAEGRPLKWILKVGLLDSETFPPAVEVKSIIKKSWDNPAQPHPEEP